MPSLAYLLLTLLTFGVCGLAIWKGGRGERSGAAVILALVIVHRLSRLVLPPEYQPLATLATDALTALGLLILTVQFASPWLGAAMLFYAAQFTLHSFYLVTGRPNDLLHYLVNNINFFGIHIALLAGTLLAWRRRAVARRTT